jgi:hypothetical protein
VTYLERFLDAGGMAIIGVVVGACLTYLFGALSRRRQEKREEKREDRTRWYETRLKAYSEYTALVLNLRVAIRTRGVSKEELDEFSKQLTAATAAMRLVASPRVLKQSEDFVHVTEAITKRESITEGELFKALAKFEAAARDDLGR